MTYNPTFIHKIVKAISVCEPSAVAEPFTFSIYRNKKETEKAAKQASKKHDALKRAAELLFIGVKQPIVAHLLLIAVQKLHV
jgi:hypothetical protein